MSRTYTKEELAEVVEKHRKWIVGDSKGERANLYGANLYGANLYGANLYGADLYRANLRGANLYGANLYGANLYGANLYRADLRGADLRSADLRSADLRSADLRCADLRCADLSGAKLDESTKWPEYWIVPEEGAFIGWKAVRSASDDRPIVLKLEIPPKALRSCCLWSRKIRVNRAKVVAAFNLDGTKCAEKEFTSDYAGTGFLWKVGKIHKMKADEEFEVNPLIECGPGLHCFITRKEAENYLS